MGQIRQVLAWVWARQQQITFIATLVMVLLGFIGIASVIYAAQAVRLQYRQYEEESFNRQQGAVSLAWRTIADANFNPSEIGQSNAFYFLVLKSQMGGNVTLDGSSLYVPLAGNKEPIFIDLSMSNICGSDLYLEVSPKSGVNLKHTLLIGTRLGGWLMQADFTGADLEQALLSEVRAPSAKFIASNFKGASIVGGTFENADFQGADLGGLQTYRGNRGAGSTYDDRAFSLGYAVTYDTNPAPTLFGSPSDIASEDEEKFGSDGRALFLVDFRGARFLKADIRGADLTNSTIGQAQVDEACADNTTKLPNGVTVRKACVEESWVGERRKLFQERTYNGRSKALQQCKAAALPPHWK